MKAVKLIALLSMMTLVVACGGDDDDDDDNNTPTTDASPGGTSDADLGAPDADPTGEPDAGDVVTPDASSITPEIDAGRGAHPSAGVVLCGDSNCNVAGGNVCCISLSGSQCVPEADCGSAGFSVPQHCDGPEDCDGSGDKCCAVFDFSGDIGSFCRTACLTVADGTEAEMCHADEDCSKPEQECRTCEYPGSPVEQHACADDSIPACT